MSKRVINNIGYAALNLIGVLIRTICRVKKNQILLWAYRGKKYSCNPRYITEYIIKNYKDKYTLIWALNNKDDFINMPDNIRCVRYNSFIFFVLLNTSEYIITNSRTKRIHHCVWKKRPMQKYIQTWHSSMSIKAVEKDAIGSVGALYITDAKEDSNRCDLILSGCKFRTEIIRKSFWYSGEILERGTPRNDIFFDPTIIEKIRHKIHEKYNIPSDAKIILYAPTFRKDNKLDYYNINWDNITIKFSQKFGDHFVTMIRLHPNLIDTCIDTSCLHMSNSIIDATLYPDMQELLAIADILITDYSSSMFDISLIRKPCFIYAVDYMTYDRKMYIPIENLPFPLSQSEEQLISSINEFNTEDYSEQIESFLNIIGNYENGSACKAVIEWMQYHQAK